jgi:hypothetical protein
VFFILEFYRTQILISTTSRFVCISRLIKVTDNNDSRWKIEILPIFIINHKRLHKTHYKFINLQSVATCFDPTGSSSGLSLEQS